MLIRDTARTFTYGAAVQAFLYINYILQFRNEVASVYKRLKMLM